MICLEPISEKKIAPVVRGFHTRGARQATTKQIAEVLGYSRQYYYKIQKEEKIVSERQTQVKHLVNAERKRMPLLGTRKIYHRIKLLLQIAGLKVGRYKLFAWMRQYGLLIPPCKRYVQQLCQNTG